MADGGISDAGRAYDWSRAALDLCARYGTPPCPSVYQVWFAYVSRESAPLTEEIDLLLSSGQEVSSEAILRLHQAYFSETPLRQGLTRIGSQISAKVDEVGGVLSASEGDASDYAKRLGVAAAKLGRNPTPEHFSQSVDKLSALANTHLAVVQKLSEELANAREDLTGFREQMSLLQELSETDHLTKIANRRMFDRVLDETIGRFEAGRSQVCLAVADLDRFKALNDEYGHATGDKALQKFAEILRAQAKGADLPARIGGEEFALILNRRSLSGAQALCDRIREYLFAAPIIDPEGRHRPVRATVSFGVTALRAEDDAASVLSRADALLYDAKDMGRNTVVSGV